MQEKRAIRTFFFLCAQFMFRLSNMWTLQTFSRKKDCKDGTKDERKGILMRNYCLGGAQWLWSERTQRIKIAVVARTTIYTLFLYEYAMMLFQIDQHPNLTLNSYQQKNKFYIQFDFYLARCWLYYIVFLQLVTKRLTISQ